MESVTPESILIHLRKISPLPDEEWQKFLSACKKYHLRKGEHFFRVGDVGKNLGIVMRGCLRLYYLNSKGEEFNRAFKFEGDLASTYTFNLEGAPSPMGAEALEDTEMLLIDLKDFLKLQEGDFCWERMAARLALSHYKRKEKREFQFLTMDASERYLELLKDYPGIENRIPQFHLASYLGITPFSLSRIVSKIKKGPKTGP